MEEFIKVAIKQFLLILQDTCPELMLKLEQAPILNSCTSFLLQQFHTSKASGIETRHQHRKPGWPQGHKWLPMGCLWSEVYSLWGSRMFNLNGFCERYKLCQKSRWWVHHFLVNSWIHCFDSNTARCCAPPACKTHLRRFPLNGFCMQMPPSAMHCTLAKAM